MRCVLLGMCVLLLGGCLTPDSKKAVAQVNNYTITVDEFNDAYKASPHTAFTYTQTRAEFLNNMINQKLILLDAEAHGLDRNKEFLNMVERFWQQSLLTLALKEKSKEGVNLDKWVADLRKNSLVKINQEYIQ